VEYRADDVRGECPPLSKAEGRELHGKQEETNLRDDGERPVKSPMIALEESVWCAHHAEARDASKHELRRTRRAQRASTHDATLPIRTHLLSLVSPAPALACLACLALGFPWRLSYMSAGAFLRTNNASSILNVSLSCRNAGGP
jgi:hypothetical protein